MAAVAKSPEPRRSRSTKNQQHEKLLLLVVKPVAAVAVLTLVAKRADLISAVRKAVANLILEATKVAVEKRLLAAAKKAPF